MRMSVEQARSIRHICELHGASAVELVYVRNQPSHPQWTVKTYDYEYVIGDTGRVITQEAVAHAF